MRAMHGTRRPVHQERFVRCIRLAIVQPGQRLIDHVFGQVIFFVVRWFDVVVVFDQARFPLRRFAGKEAIEVIEAIAGWPAIFRADRCCFGGGRVVPLAERRRRITIVSQHFSDRGRFFRNHSGVTIKRDGPFSDRARADSRVISSRQQTGSRRRTDRCRVKRVVAKSFFGQFRKSRRVHFAAERFGNTKARVIQQHDQNVRSICRQSLRLLRPLHRGILQPWLCDAVHGRGRKGQHAANTILSQRLLRKQEHECNCDSCSMQSYTFKWMHDFAFALQTEWSSGQYSLDSEASERNASLPISFLVQAYWSGTACGCSSGAGSSSRTSNQFSTFSAPK